MAAGASRRKSISCSGRGCRPPQAAQLAQEPRKHQDSRPRARSLYSAGGRPVSFAGSGCSSPAPAASRARRGALLSTKDRWTLRRSSSTSLR
eukprot:4685433-Alexandrium_andersonii.AAC.1